MSFRRGEGLIGWVVDAGEPTRVDEVKSHPRWVQSKSQTFQVTSFLAEPLWSNGEVIGVLSVTSPTLGGESVLFGSLQIRFDTARGIDYHRGAPSGAANHV